MLGTVKNQTYFNWEHLICSDGIYEPQIESIVRSNNDPRCQYLVSSQHYGGYGASVRQEIMLNARGDYLVFLDDDNLLMLNYLEEMITALQNAINNEKFAICEIMHFGPVQMFLGNPPIILKGEPKIYFIDTLQVMVEARAMKEIGWVNNGYCADGSTYEELGKHFSFVRVPKLLAIHY
jgi:glycosyltransferase involved in cell wall biosynthesis